MLGLGWSEIFIIVVVALLVIGPDKLPEVLRGAAKFFRQLQRVATEVRQSLDVVLQEPPPQRTTTQPSNQGVTPVRQEATPANEGPPPPHGGQPPSIKPDLPSQD